MSSPTFKRCGCRAPDGAELGATCPKLRRRNGSWNPEHGTWNYRLPLPPTRDGGRRRLRRAGFSSERDALAEIQHVHALLAIPDPTDHDAIDQLVNQLQDAVKTGSRLPDVDQVRTRLRAGVPLGQLPTLGPWLDSWLASRKKISRNTRRSYESHIRLYFTPAIGHIRLDRLTINHLVDLFDGIEERNTAIRDARASDDPKVRRSVRGARTIGAASMQRIRATLRKALNDAITQQLIITNPAVHVELPDGKRPKPLVWTDERVARWRETGHVPNPVMVWTPAHTGRFLDHLAATGDRLYALYHLLAFQGLRRGEGCGLHWTELDLPNQTAHVWVQLVQYGWETDIADVKTDASEDIVTLDADTVAVLKAHRTAQKKERLAAGSAWVDTGLVFTTPTGRALHPADVTDHFVRQVAEAGLPPIRLHDLRHGTATLALAAGIDIKIVSAMLRHSSVTITADTYASVLPEVARDAAAATARMVPRDHVPTRGHTLAPRKIKKAVGETDGNAKGQDEKGKRSAPSGTRTPNPLIKSQLLCQLS